jgi:WD40 repeat protein
MRTLAIHSNHVRCLAYSPDGSLLATASNDQSVRLLDTATGKKVRSWSGLGGVMQAVAFSPDGKRIAFGGQIDFVFTDGWGPGSSRMGAVPIRAQRTAHVTALAYTPDGKTILCGTGDRILSVEGHLHVLDAEPLRVRLSRAERFGVQHLALRADGAQVVLGLGGGWSFAEPPAWAPGTCCSRGRNVSAVAFSPDGGTVAVSDGFGIYLPLWAGEQSFRMLKGHHGRVTSLAFTPDGRKLLSGSWDRTVRIWDVASGREESALAWERGKAQYVAVSPDGMTAAAACDKGVVIWDLDP